MSMRRSFHTGAAISFALLATAAGCSDDAASTGPDGTGGTGGDAEDGGGAPSAGGGGEGAGSAALSFVSPTTATSLIHSAVVELSASADIDAAEVTLVGEDTPRCSFDARPFICLVDLASLPAGPFTLEATGLSGATETAQASIDLEHRALPADVCPDTTAPTDCIAALVAAGAGAGYEGLSYHCMDDGHAAVDTTGMTGLESQINQASAGSDPWHLDPARIVIANQSQAFNFSDGWMSIPRNGTVTMHDVTWEASKLFLWPEHRDHGHADYYAWQTPTLLLSQGSSGSELDEVAKLLHILAAFQGDARAQMHDAGVLMAATTFVHRRARVATDLEYVSAAAHPPAFRDADTVRAGIRLASSILLDELPPLARLSAEEAVIPPAWTDLGFTQLETSPYALTWSSMALPAAVPEGTFSAVIDLSGSEDVNARPLHYFAAVVRGDAAQVRVTQLDVARFRIESEWPLDVTEDVGGQPRSSRRATIAFVAHNGLWPSAPAFVSIFGGNPFEHAPDSNDFD